MNEKIKTQLREYLDLKLRLCKQYMREQDLTAAKTVWQQAIGAVEFTAMSQFGINFDNDLAIEIEDIWLLDFKEAFEKTLFPEVVESPPSASGSVITLLTKGLTALPILLLPLDLVRLSPASW